VTSEADDRLASRKVAAALRELIAAGEYGPGDQLPSYRQLAADHDVAVNTAQSAVRILASEGLVEIRHGSGAFVRSPSEGAPSLREELTRLQGRLHHTQQELASVSEAVAHVLARLPEDSAGEA